MKDGNTERVGKEIQPSKDRLRGWLAQPGSRRLSIAPLPLRNSPASRFNARRAANCLPPHAAFAWRASTPLILPRSPGRKRWCCRRRTRRTQNARSEPVRYPWRIFFAVLGSLSCLPSSSKDSGRNRRLSWRWGECRPLPVSGYFSMRSGSAFPGRCGGDGLDAAARRHLSLVPGTQKKAPITRAVCGSGGGARHSLPAFCFAYFSWPV